MAPEDSAWQAMPHLCKIGCTFRSVLQRQGLQLPDHYNTLKCKEDVNVINTVSVNNPDRMIGGQLPNPNECSSTLMSETRGEMLTSKP